MPRIGVIALLSLVLVATAVWADGVIVGATCPITWTASTSPNLKEYHLYLSKSKGQYDMTKPAAAPVPAPTTQANCSALGMTTDGQYYLIVTVLNLSGRESVPSNEVPFVRDTTVPNPPTSLTVGP